MLDRCTLQALVALALVVPDQAAAPEDAADPGTIVHEPDAESVTEDWVGGGAIAFLPHTADEDPEPVNEGAEPVAEAVASSPVPVVPSNQLWSPSPKTNTPNSGGTMSKEEFAVCVAAGWCT